MARRNATRKQVELTADSLPADITRPSLVLANPLVGQSLAVPRACDVRAGDTPTREPAIWWQTPPRLGKEDTALAWGRGGTAEKAFWAFIGLADEPDPERFVTFVQRFGPLGLWPYELPTGKKVHGLHYWVPSVTEGIWTPYRFEADWPRDHQKLREAGLISMLYEPLSEWRRWASWLRAVVQIAYALRIGSVGDRQDWKSLGFDDLYAPKGMKGRHVDFPTSVERQWSYLTSVIQNRFLKWSGLVPVMRSTAGRPYVALALGGREAIHMRRASAQQDWPENALFPALVAHLLAVITAGQHVAQCTRCGRPHPRLRRARADQPAYCSEDCRRDARRESKRKSDRKRRVDSRNDSKTQERRRTATDVQGTNMA